jgi:NADPH:quinone reductase-like Zn-dependent oxidoreductase
VPATVRFGWTPEIEQNAVLVVRANPDVSLLLTEGHPYGLLILTAKHASDEVFDDHIPEEQDQAILDWNARKLRGRSVALAVGGETTESLVPTVREGGVLIVIASAPPEEAAKERGIRADLHVTEPSPDELRRIADLIASGEVNVEIAEVIPITEIQRAHEVSQSGHVRGKLVLSVSA